MGGVDKVSKRFRSRFNSDRPLINVEVFFQCLYSSRFGLDPVQRFSHFSIMMCCYGIQIHGNSLMNKFVCQNKHQRFT